MTLVQEALARLRADQASGALEELCASQHIAVLMLHGSVLRDAALARDLDLAYCFERGVRGDEFAVATAFIARYGDHVDLMPLDRAGAVAKFGALNYGEPLVERVPEMVARLRIAAFGQYRDEEPFRRAALERLAHGS